MVELLCADKPVKSVSVEVTLDDDNVMVTIDNSSLTTLLEGQCMMSTVKKPPSMTEVMLEC